MRRLSDPRYIKPETVDIGDTIRVVSPDLEDGVERSAVGTVARRDDNGQVRSYFTAQGGRLLTWEPGKPSPRVTLLDRPEHPQETLFAMADLPGMDDVRAAYT